jgi:hypothetical protein
MKEVRIAIGFECGDRFGDCIREIVEGEEHWPPSQGSDPAEIEAHRRRLAQELFDGADLVDLVGHSTPIKCFLKIGDWVLDRAAADKLASFLPSSVRIVRLIGCSTASTEDGRAAAAALTRDRLDAYGTLNKVYSTHFDKGGVKKGIGAPSMRGFFPAGRAPTPLPTAGGAADKQRSRVLLVWLGRRPWRAILRIYRRIRRLFPSREDPWSRISGLLHPGGTAMPGLLTEPLLVFQVESRSASGTLEILFDFECARFYASVGTVGDHDLVYEVRGFGQAAKTPLEAYLERGPRGVTLIGRHKEAGDRCDAARPLGKRIEGVSPYGHLFWLVLLVGAAGVTLALWLVVAPGPPPPPLDAMAIDAPVDGQLDTGWPPIDAPVDGQLDTVPPHSPTPVEPPGCAALTPTKTYTGFVDEYTSPQTYGAATCPQSLSIEIDDYSPDYLGEEGTEKGGTFVVWADADLRAKSGCEETWIRADLYRQISGKWMFVSRKEGHGERCQPPRVSWRNADDDPDVLVAGSNYRIVSTAWTSPTGTIRTTRKFRVFSVWDHKVPK